jgi:hypothetical protein
VGNSTSRMLDCRMCFQAPAKSHKGLVKSPEGGFVFTQGQVHCITKVHSLFIPMQRPNESVELLRLEIFETTKQTKRLRNLPTLAFARPFNRYRASMLVSRAITWPSTHFVASSAALSREWMAALKSDTSGSFLPGLARTPRTSLGCVRGKCVVGVRERPVAVRLTMNSVPGGR